MWCSKCRFEAANPKELMLHEASRHMIIYKCAECFLQFQTQEAAQLHILEDHLNTNLNLPNAAAPIPSLTPVNSSPGHARVIKEEGDTCKLAKRIKLESPPQDQQDHEHKDPTGTKEQQYSYSESPKSSRKRPFTAADLKPEPNVVLDKGQLPARNTQ